MIEMTNSAALATQFHRKESNNIMTHFEATLTKIAGPREGTDARYEAFVADTKIGTVHRCRKAWQRTPLTGWELRTLAEEYPEGSPARKAGKKVRRFGNTLAQIKEEALESARAQGLLDAPEEEIEAVPQEGIFFSQPSADGVVSIYVDGGYEGHACEDPSWDRGPWGVFWTTDTQFGEDIAAQTRLEALSLAQERIEETLAPTPMAALLRDAEIDAEDASKRVKEIRAAIAHKAAYIADRTLLGFTTALIEEIKKLAEIGKELEDAQVHLNRCGAWELKCRVKAQEEAERLSKESPASMDERAKAAIRSALMDTAGSLTLDALMDRLRDEGEIDAESFESAYDAMVETGEACTEGEGLDALVWLAA